MRVRGPCIEPGVTRFARDGIPGEIPMKIAARTFLLAASVSAGLLLLSTSCSKMSTAPSPVAPDVQSARVAAPAAVRVGISSLTRSALIDGGKGGTLSVGRWRVLVPAGAYSGIGTITVTVPDTSVAKCDLFISPSSLNNFQEKVDLRYRWTSADDAKTHDMRWWNPTTKTWVVIESWPEGSEVCAPLRHFSSYWSGKAGW
jgi:hypothetical protein